MNPLTVEWVDKAERDYLTAGREVRVRRRANWDAVCFHAQQSAEKYLKAFLHHHNITFPKTHDLIELLELCLSSDASFEFQRGALILLNRYAVSYRYPGASADKDEAKSAYNTIKSVRTFMRVKLGLV